MYRNRTRARAAMSLGVITAVILAMDGYKRGNLDDYVLAVGVLALSLSVAVNFYLIERTQRARRRIEGLQSILKVRRIS